MENAIWDTLEELFCSGSMFPWYIPWERMLIKMLTAWTSANVNDSLPGFNYSDSGVGRTVLEGRRWMSYGTPSVCLRSPLAPDQHARHAAPLLREHIATETTDLVWSLTWCLCCRDSSPSYTWLERYLMVRHEVSSEWWWWWWCKLVGIGPDSSTTTGEFGNYA